MRDIFDCCADILNDDGGRADNSSGQIREPLLHDDIRKRQSRKNKPDVNEWFVVSVVGSWSTNQRRVGSRRRNIRNTTVVEIAANPGVETHAAWVVHTQMCAGLGCVGIIVRRLIVASKVASVSGSVLDTKNGNCKDKNETEG